MIVAQEEPLRLCFEPWANEYTVPPGLSVIVEFGDDGRPVEVVHEADGIIFHSGGLHPDVWSLDGEPLFVLSDTMPVSPDMTKYLKPLGRPALQRDRTGQAGS
ncbi:hypothetical protein [Streptomyces sp. NPDC041003]|uniref:hypothetical protein n=1 Tax=Streptomyces sp. NPDC041003 TaxID=3155730 RepID=UPI0033DAE611